MLLQALIRVRIHIMAQIINYIFGLLWLFKGEMTISKTKRVKPSVAKGIGTMLVIVATVTAFIPSVNNSGILVYSVLLVAPIFLAIIVGFANSEEKTAEYPTDEVMEKKELTIWQAIKMGVMIGFVFLVLCIIFFSSTADYKHPLDETIVLIISGVIVIIMGTIGALVGYAFGKNRIATRISAIIGTILGIAGWLLTLVMILPQ